MRLTVKGTVRGMVIITAKGMLRITDNDMVINGKCIVSYGIMYGDNYS